MGSLPPSVKPEDLRRLFENFGVVTECDIMNRCGFVHMENAEMAENAIRSLNNTNFKGITISVEPGRMKERGGGKGRGGGAGGRNGNGLGGGFGRGGMRSGPRDNFMRGPGGPRNNNGGKRIKSDFTLQQHTQNSRICRDIEVINILIILNFNFLTKNSVTDLKQFRSVLFVIKSKHINAVIKNRLCV